ncbi:MAG: hypothetical protein N2512_10620 [Armatimonadetes bacterium]|nr:hypothetical protein [Armatimonadota bacterium]
MNLTQNFLYSQGSPHHGTGGEKAAEDDRRPPANTAAAPLPDC